MRYTAVVVLAAMRAGAGFAQPPEPEPLPLPLPPTPAPKAIGLKSPKGIEQPKPEEVAAKPEGASSERAGSSVSVRGATGANGSGSIEPGTSAVRPKAVAPVAFSFAMASISA